ncbi:MAG TPA: DUF1501 domain-containing protein [Acidobacteriaceae bacterium]|nr:DUF1501 domain-containing protein [Acidobacteriaceae bacterium]
MTISRRAFLKNGALAVVGTSAIPSFLTRSVLAQTANLRAGGRRLVVIFQRGAADGLNIVIPHGEPGYYQMRPTIAIPREQVIDLDGFFGLHPALAPLQPLWKQGHLALVHAAGSPDTTRSHFDAQDYMESGTPGLKSTPDGWLNRALQAEDEQRRTRDTSPFRAVAVTNAVPRTLKGLVPAVALRNLGDFRALDTYDKLANDPFQAMYDDSSNVTMRNAGKEAFHAMQMLRSANAAGYTPAPGANYPGSSLGQSLKQIAQLMKSNFGVEAAFADVGGWDHHHNEGGVNGQLGNSLRNYAAAISAFWTDLGDDAGNTVLVTMSEFGRTARQNGTGGTDHGHANVMFVLGGPVRGGHVYGKWPGLAQEQLYQGRDLALTTDFRQVLSEAAYKTVGARDLHRVFPGSTLQSRQFLNLIA